MQTRQKEELREVLIDEVGNALIDYLKFARPESAYRQVFLRLRPPHIPFNKSTHLNEVVRYWKNLAGIKFKSKQHHGLHSLRHSLATYLLEEETAFPVISNILGHASTGSTMIYAKSSIEMLRQVALPVTEVSYVKQ